MMVFFFLLLFSHFEVPVTGFIGVALLSGQMKDFLAEDGSKFLV